MRIRFLPGALLVLSAVSLAAVPEGIPRELARQRAAAISDVRYRLRFTLDPKSATVQGGEVLEFRLKEKPVCTVPAPHQEDTCLDKDIVLDYRDGTVDAVTVNGHRLTLKVHQCVEPPDTNKIECIPNVDEIQRGHLLLPYTVLQAGENRVEIGFTSNVAPAGKPFIRYEDRDDGSQYIYTLFVPMDASMAFPCFDQPDLKARFELTVGAPRDWTVVSNTRPERVLAHGFGMDWTFAETQPISTYLF